VILTKWNSGLQPLQSHIKHSATKDRGSIKPAPSSSDNVFIARRRHIDALEKSAEFVANALMQLEHAAGELVAEDLRQAQNHLSEITGTFTSDDLLGRIFSSFCIGK
jgi:tRNA modification GTPase